MLYYYIFELNILWSPGITKKTGRIPKSQRVGKFKTKKSAKSIKLNLQHP